MPFWVPKTRIKLKDSSDRLSLDGNFGEFLEQKNKTVFLRPIMGQKKIFFTAGLFAAVFLIIFLRVGYLQIVRGGYYREQSENNRIKTYIIPSYRGIIYDRNNASLVQNKSSFTLSLIPNKLPFDPEEKDKLLETIATAIDLPKKEIEAILIDYQSYSNEAILIYSNLSHEAMLMLTKLSFNQPSIVVTEQVSREYINNSPSMSHVLGYIGAISKEEYEKRRERGYFLRDFIGKTGVELSYEEILRGKFGKKQTEINAFGEEKRIIAKEEAAPGRDLILTIDAKIQSQLEKIITGYLKIYNKKRAAAILMNPRNGDVLALVSLPAFSNNDFTGGISAEIYNKLTNNPDQPLFFRAISGEYPSGSVIKPLWALAALEEGLITSNTTFLSTGGIKIGNWFFPDWKIGGHGITNVTKAIAESINTFFYYIGGGFGNFNGLGLDKMVKYATILGIGEKTGIDLPFEKTGFLPDADWKEKTYGQPWYIGDTYHLSIGQGFLSVTPIQIAVLTSTIANGGDLIAPRVVKKIVGGEKTEEAPILYKKQNFLKKENLEAIKKGMRDTVLYGSASRLGSLGINVAGKTGTAQTSSQRPPHAWFTGFFPYENPELVITVLVEEGGEGSRISTQITRDFILWYQLYSNQNSKSLQDNF